MSELQRHGTFNQSAGTVMFRASRAFDRVLLSQAEKKQLRLGTARSAAEPHEAGPTSGLRCGRLPCHPTSRRAIQHSACKASKHQTRLACVWCYGVGLWDRCNDYWGQLGPCLWWKETSASVVLRRRLVEGGGGGSARDALASDDGAFCASGGGGGSVSGRDQERLVFYFRTTNASTAPYAPKLSWVKPGRDA